MRIEIDRAICQGNQLCLGIAPDVFDVDDDGIAFVVLAELPPTEERRAEQAVLSCPTQAIRLER